MTDRKFRLCAFAFSLFLPFTMSVLVWSQNSSHDPDRLQSQASLQNQDPEKEMYWEKEQLLEQLKETETKQEHLQEPIPSQDRSKSPSSPLTGSNRGVGQGGEMGQGGGR
ncbi:MAG: hypothetical protein NPIRA04_02520 [Nitrospirales bacterium]|nr:MAG: hypothetical protein NPIRA04_02520 [Nitrospirales bacterium]